MVVKWCFKYEVFNVNMKPFKWRPKNGAVFIQLFMELFFFQLLSLSMQPFLCCNLFSLHFMQFFLCSSLVTTRARLGPDHQPRTQAHFTPPWNEPGYEVAWWSAKQYPASGYWGLLGVGDMATLVYSAFFVVSLVLSVVVFYTIDSKNIATNTEIWNFGFLHSL